VAKESLRKAYNLDPSTGMWKQELGFILIAEGTHKEVESMCEDSSLPSKLLMAKLLEAKGEYALALETLEEVIANPPKGVYDGRAVPVEAQLAKAKYIYAQCARRAGDPLKGISMLGRPNVIRSTPPHLVNDAITDNLETLFEKGHCYDAAGDYAAAWDCFLAGNRFQKLPFDAVSYKERIRSVLEAPHTQAGVGGERLIFIVGIPRSGTSLVEQILGRHSQVTPMGERQEVPLIADQLGKRGWPDLEASEIAKFSDYYLKDCPSEGFITDKMPDNWYHASLIRQLFPQAQIVHCLRNPEDCLVSCFMQMFSGAGMAWANSLEGLSTYYELWESCEVGGVEVHYEELVSHPDDGIRTLLESLKLPFEEGCLHPEGSSRYVPTASYAQVKEPIHSRSVGRGANYAKYLPLKREPRDRSHGAG
jgi:tetratricopeptide (TPR) repeat protein